MYGSVVKQLKLMAIPPVLPPWRRNRRSLPYCRRWTLFPEMPDLWKCFLQRTGWAKFWRKKTMPMPIRQNVWNLLFEGFVPMQKFQTNFIWLSRKNNDVTEEWSASYDDCNDSIDDCIDPVEPWLGGWKLVYFWLYSKKISPCKMPD